MQGVLITRVEPMSSSFDGGLERGTVLLEINRQPVAIVADYKRIAASRAAGRLLTLYRLRADLDQRQLKTVRVEAVDSATRRHGTRRRLTRLRHAQIAHPGHRR